MDWGDVVDKAIDYFSSNSAEFSECLDELERLDDYVSNHKDDYESYEYFYMDDFDDIYGSDSVLDVIKSLDTDFDPYDVYFYDDGSICSTNEKEYDIDDDDLLDDEFVEALYDNKNYMDLPGYIEKLFNAYDDNDDDEDEEEEEDEDGNEEDKE